MKTLFKGVILLTVCISLFSTTFAQQDFDAKDAFVEAESYFLFEEYADALPIYQRILRIEPNNYNVMYKIGICYLNNEFQKDRSIKYLLEASNHISNSFRYNNYREKQAPPETIYHLGQAYRVNGQIKKAIEYYNLFKRNIDPKIYDITVVEEEIKSCESALVLMSKEVYFKPKNLGENFNSRFSETNAVISADGNHIAFNRKLQFYNAPFICSKDNDGNWGPPYNLTPDFKLDGDSYITGISADGKEIFVYRSDDFDGNIYVSKKVNDRWQKLRKLNDNINTKYWESHASLSPDGKFLYFTSNRTGGFGGLDIYRSPRKSDGSWGKPVNLGRIINSPSNEDTPFISSDNTKLFFSSLDHKTIGGYDLFVSQLKDEDWTKPVNMGYPLNTTDDDIFFCPLPVDLGTGSGIYSRADRDNTYGLRDLFWVDVYNQVLLRPFKIKGQIAVMDSGLSATNRELIVSLIDLKSGKVAAKTTTDVTGDFTLEANQGSYQLVVEGNGIKPITSLVDLDLTQDLSSIELSGMVAEVAKTSDDLVVEAPDVLPKLEVAGKQTIVTDSSRASIEMSVQKGSDLKIEILRNNITEKTEEYRTNREKFTYLLELEPGENKLLLTIKDAKGNTNQKEIIVYYQPQPIESELASSEGQIQTESNTVIQEVANLTEGNLKDYLLSDDELEYSSVADLYSLLITKAEENDYTSNEVDELISVLLTQRDKTEFINSAKKSDKLELMFLNDTLIKSTNVPISLVRKTRPLYTSDENELNEGLIDIIPFTGNLNQEIDYILSFAHSKTSRTDSVTGLTSEQKLNYLNSIMKGDEVSNSLELASTTQNLDQFYQNLLLSTDENLKMLLEETNFDSLGIDNSIELVAHLLEVSGEKGIPVKNIIIAIEQAYTNTNTNLQQFRESLANAATGNLKTAINDLDLKQSDYNEFNDIIEDLIRKSKRDGYGRTEVYNLLIDMTGTESVDDFIEALQKNANGNLKDVVENLNPSDFSLPIEVVQYLLSQTGVFNYTDSDINNLLIKMLLEQGLDNWGQNYAEAYSLKQRRTIWTTAILSGLLLILIIILLRRKKRKKTESN